MRRRFIPSLSTPSLLCRFACTLLCLLASVFGPSASAAGVLTGSSVAISTSQTIDLTTLGTADWAHWGLNANNTPGEFDHKAVGGTPVGLISTYTILGGGTINGFNYNLLNCTWTDGTPTASVGGTKTEDYTLSSANGSGFRITVPADTTSRTLTIYVGGYNDEAKLTAHLSDGSAADFVDTSYGYDKPGNSNGANYQAAYTLTYNAASAGQTLTVSWVQTSTPPGNGNVNLQAATLAITPPGVPIALSATGSTSQISLTWAAASGDTSYNLYRGTVAGGEGTTPYQTGLTGTSYMDTGIVSGTTYYYTMRGVNNGVTSGASNEASSAIIDFALAASPNNFGIPITGSAPTALTLTPSVTFNGSATLSVSGLPTGVTGTFTPASPVTLTAGTAVIDTLTLTSNAATVGSYPLTVTATSGTSTRSTALTLTVVPGPVVSTVRLTDIFLTGSTPTLQLQWPAYTGTGTNITYTVIRSGTTITGYTVNGNTVTLNDSTNVQLNTSTQSPITYQYTVTAYYTDTGGNVHSVSVGTCTVVPMKAVASDDQAIDSRLDPRYSANVLINHNFGNTLSMAYRGGLFAGYISDPSKVGRSLIKFLLPTVPSGQYAWRVGSVYAYATRGYTSGATSTTTVSCQRISDLWTGATATWSLAPAMPSASNGVAVTYDGTSQINSGINWIRWPFFTDIYSALLSNGGTLSVGLASTSETNNGWTYFAKKEYDATLTPFVLYAYGAPN